MTTLTDKEAAEEEPFPAKPAARRGITSRAILLGLLAVPLNVWWVTIIEVKWGGLDGSCLPLFATPVFMLFCLVALNLAVKRLKPRWAFSQQELLVVYVMLVISETMAGHDMLQNMMGAIPHPYFYATRENGWQSLFFRHLPRWLLVADGSSLEGFYYGGESMYRWRFLTGWLLPLGIWSFFVLALVVVMICLNVLIRQQWTESEKLTYPIVQLPLRLTEDGEGEKMLRNGVMWMGFALAFSVGLLNGISFLNPSVPRIAAVKLYNVAPAYFSGWPWSAMGGLEISMYPFMIGLAFFLPSDLAFSCWFFFLFSKAERIAGAALGWQDVPGFPFFKEQASGAWIGLGVSALWFTRRHLKEVFKKALGLESGVADQRESASYRWASVGLLGGLVILAIISWLAGMTLWAICVFFGIYFLLALAISRVRAEFGAPHEIFFVNPQDIMATAIGTKFLPGRTMAAMCTFYWFNRCFRNHPMPNQLESFKMGQETRMPLRSLAWVILLATAAGMVFTYWSHLHILYQDGAIHALGYKDWVGESSFGRLANWMRQPTGPDMRGIIFMVLGFAFMFMLRGGRNLFFKWPFHPAGYALAVSYAMNYFWFCFFLAWVAKIVLNHVGGISSRRAATPFFMGLILGDFAIGCLWAIIGAVWEMPVYKTYIL